MFVANAVFNNDRIPAGSLQGKDGQFLVCLIQDLLATMDVEEVFRDDDNVMEEEDTDEITEV